MYRLFSIPVQNLFVVALVLKVLLSALGWWTGNLWGLSVSLPLGVMLGYIVIGLRRTDKTVSDEKFADSCYYLGFIFTITSIIFSLFDLPHIDAKMSDIAVRFGAAMVSTVIGLGVRVRLVSFRPDIQDAIRSAEDGVVDASRRLREQLNIVVEKMQEFESKVNEATTSTVSRVSVSIEEMTQSYGAQLTDYFAELTKGNEQAFKAALEEVSAASLRLSQSVDEYSNTMKGNLKSIEGKVTHFADAVTKRLEQTTFPDDYFSKQLAEPLTQLGLSTKSMASQVEGASEDVSKAISTLRKRSSQVEGALDRVVELASSQETLLAGSQAQVDTLSLLSSTLRATQEGLDTLRSTLASQGEGLQQNTALAEGHSNALAATASTLRTLEASLHKTLERIDSQQQSVASVAGLTTAQNKTLEVLTQSLQAVSRELQNVAESVEKNSAGLSDTAQRMARVESASERAHTDTRGALQELVVAQSELPKLGQSLLQLSAELGEMRSDIRAAVPPLPNGKPVATEHPFGADALPPHSRPHMDDFGNEHGADARS